MMVLTTTALSITAATQSKLSSRCTTCLYKPIVIAAGIFYSAGINNLEDQGGADISLCHSLNGALRQNHWQVESRAVHYFPQLSFNPTAKLNTGFPAA